MEKNPRLTSIDAPPLRLGSDKPPQPNASAADAASPTSANPEATSTNNTTK